EWTHLRNLDVIKSRTRYRKRRDSDTAVVETSAGNWIESLQRKMRVQCEPLEHGQHDLHVDGQPILEQIVTDDEIGNSGTKIHGRQCRDCVLLQVETQPGFGSAPHS